MVPHIAFHQPDDGYFQAQRFGPLAVRFTLVASPNRLLPVLSPGVCTNAVLIQKKFKNVSRTWSMQLALGMSSFLKIKTHSGKYSFLSSIFGKLDMIIRLTEKKLLSVYPPKVSMTTFSAIQSTLTQNITPPRYSTTPTSGWWNISTHSVETTVNCTMPTLCRCWIPALM